MTHPGWRSVYEAQCRAVRDASRAVRALRHPWLFDLDLSTAYTALMEGAEACRILAESLDDYLIREQGSGARGQEVGIREHLPPSNSVAEPRPAEPRLQSRANRWSVVGGQDSKEAVVRLYSQDAKPSTIDH